MPRFDVPDKFNKDKAFTRVKFGRDATLLDIELDEMQKIPQYKLEKAISNIVVDGFVSKTTMTLTGGTITVPVDTVYFQGKTIEILEPMTLAGLTTADKVYLSVWEEVVDFDDVIKKGGNISGGTTISNTDIIDVEFGSESTRRVQQKVQLLKVNTDVTKQHLLLATLTGATTFTDNRVKININIDVLPSKVLQDATNRFMTDVERAKLSGIETSANLYVHPTTHLPSIIVQDASNRFMTDTERTKLAGVAIGATNYTHPVNHPASIITQDLNNRFSTDAEKAVWNAKETTTGAQAKADLAETNSKSYTDTKVSALVASAPAVLDTLDELASALGDDPNFAVTMTNLIGTKETPAGADAKIATHAGITDIHVSLVEKATWNAKASTAVVTTTVNGLMIFGDKVKLDGIAVNANNYVHPATHAPSVIVQDASNRFVTDTQITKLAGIETGANLYTHPVNHPASIITQDLNNRFVTDVQIAKLAGIADNANNYIHPASHAPSIITQDLNNRFSTDAEKAVWNAKAPTTAVTTTVNGLMIFGDKVKLDGIAVNANNYVHPANHSPSVITQDASNRFVTDTQITAWDAKATTAVATSVVSGLMPNTDKAKLDAFTVVSVASANAVLKLDANSKLPASITGNADGNSATATKLFTPRAIAISGDGTGTVNFDGTVGVTIPLVLKNSGAVAGTYPKVTVDAKGIVTAGTPLVAGDIPLLDYAKISTGKPTTVAGYGITDVSPTTKNTATLPAIAGWYRIATSWLGIDRNAGRFEIDWSLSAVHGQVNFNAGIMYGVDPTINQTFYSTFDGTKGITKCRIVYHVTYTGNYAYLEVYNASASAVALTVQLASSIGWALMTPIAGSIPAGYSNAELTFKDGIVTDTQLVSQIATGTAPLAVTSTTMVANLNAELLGGNSASAFAPVAHVGTGGASHLAVTTTVNGFMIFGDKVKLDGIALNANNYSHPTGAGSNHIPTGGTVGQVLTNSASGVAVWSAPTSTATAIAITDTGAYYTGTNAELALQEIGQMLNATRGNLITSVTTLLGS